ncbi:PHP domain-containing protein [Planctobacterium marinum]|uniref:PHP domain-containing protein n=1 Tax=Planctobacterium marinum TaxID=1631968 RepID=UPI001E32B3EF|nr:PHP domain-containing protein [Planctobacterium marinum]MCC2605580.1 PHP domain-containing protein [Planctobacterium marinum]
MKIDLHCHTYYSDGQLSPEELILRAHNMQLDALAITDHDTVAALDEAMAFQAQQKRALKIIPGIELSTGWHGFDIHILGLNIDREDSVFQQRLEQQAAARQERALAIAEKLAKCGLDDVYDAACRYAGKGQITRAHFARVMVEKGHVHNFDAAFKKYLGKGKRAHVSPRWISIDEAIQWIQEAGGSAVLAHPGHYDLSGKWLRRLIVYFKQAGGDGMEVCHPHLPPDRQRQMATYAQEYQLLASAGSDFHAPGRWTELGRHLNIPAHLTPVWHNWSSITNDNNKEVLS